MFQSLFGCCTQRKKEENKDIYSEIPESKKDSYSELFDKKEKKMKIKNKSQRSLLKRAIKRVNDSSYKSCIQADDLQEIIEKNFIQSENGEIAHKGVYLAEIFEQPYFLLANEHEQDEFLNSLKVNCFLLLICNENQQRNKSVKCGELVKLVIEEAKKISYDLNNSKVDTENYKFHRRDPATLEVLGVLFASAILPFINLLYEDLEGDEEFDHLVKNATTNSKVFIKFAKFMMKNYIFSSSEKKERKKGQTVTYKPFKFKEKLANAFHYFFEIKTIRKRFLYFAMNHRDICLAPDQDEIDEEPKQQLNFRPEYESPNQKQLIVENPFLDRSGVYASEYPAGLEKKQHSVPDFYTAEPTEEVVDTDDKFGSLSNLIEEHERASDIDFNQTLYRHDDTMVLGRKSNLSFVSTNANIINNKEADFKQELNEKYGPDLLNVLEIYFKRNIKNGVYSCDSESCNIAGLFEKLEQEYNEQSSDDEIILKHRLSQSFRHSSHLGDQDESFITAQDYMKSVLKAQTSTRDFYEFFYGNYSCCIGIINSYLRLLEVYDDFTFSCEELRNPKKECHRTKIFETDLLEEFEKENETNIKSDALNEEFKNFDDHDLLIVPIFTENTLLIFAVALDVEKSHVRLYYQEDKVSEEDDERMTEYSQIIINLLERAYQTANMNFDDREIEGSTIGVKHIPEMVQRIEELIGIAPESEIDISEENIRHTIIDRLLAVQNL
ncbi:unnamed protein product [Moneuplotes crassus]|uniref:Uncharacterized protein n=1 Tax=Euplotes crassus TaxID=5936 RepID=A0AAD2D832_EUPCR|nr:unnamed protein product [Moneuplotes crassus]